MKRSENPFREFWLFGGYLLIGWLISRYFGVEKPFLIVSLLSYLFWHLYNVVRLMLWLGDSVRPVPDEMPGIWNEIFHLLYIRRRQRQQTKKRLVEVVGEFRDSANSLPEAAVAVDAHGEIVWFNKGAQGLLGLVPQRDVGQRITNLIRHPGFVEFEAMPTSTRALVIPSPNVAGTMLSFRFSPYRAKQRLLMVRDVTRLHRLEQMRKDFVANVSHELRTPVTVLIGYLETMLSSTDEKLGRYQRPLQQMQQQAKRMSAIVDDLLLLSRLDDERNRLSQEEVDVPALVAMIAEDAKVLSGDANQDITATVDSPVGLFGAPKELQSAFWNLVSNAVRYTPPGGRITIHWGKDKDGAVRFSVSDSGPGIEAAHIPRLTERFYRVDAGRSREVGGTGLGLAIVKHVLERHNARLDIESAVGRGSTFSCVFPPSRQIQLRPATAKESR